MTLSRDTELGTISISNVLFAQIIAGGFNLPGCRGRVWPSTKRGRQIGSDDKFTMSEFASAIEVDQSFEEDNIDIEFSIIVKFGTSIAKVTDILCDHIAETLHAKQGRYPNQIKVHIAGVKSRQIGRRNLEVIKRYENK